MAAVRRLRGRESHRPGELSDAQYSLLFGLRESDAVPHKRARAGGRPQPREHDRDARLAGGRGTRHPRSAQSSDRRVVLTSLTERGRELVEERRARYEPRWLAALEDVSERDLLAAADVLDRLRGLFDELAAERVVDDERVA